MESMKNMTLKYLFPIKNTVFTISMAGLLIGLRLLIGLFSINVGPMVLSFSWIALFMIGFILGPLIGYFVGWITDSLSWVIHGDLWMWEYSIQEPIICLIGGLIGILYKLLQNNKSKWTMFVVFETVFTGMVIFGLYMVARYFNYENNKNDDFFSSTWVKISGLVMISIFYISINALVISMMIRNSDPNLIIVVALVVTITTIIFSWIIGPWAMKRWYEHQYGSTSSQFKNYGYKYYTLSRILKSMFVVPIEITLTYPLWKSFILWSKQSELVR